MNKKQHRVDNWTAGEQSLLVMKMRKRFEKIGQIDKAKRSFRLDITQSYLCSCCHLAVVSTRRGTGSCNSHHCPDTGVHTPAESSDTRSYLQQEGFTVEGLLSACQ